MIRQGCSESRCSRRVIIERGFSPDVRLRGLHKRHRRREPLEVVVVLDRRANAELGQEVDRLGERDVQLMSERAEGDPACPVVAQHQEDPSVVHELPRHRGYLLLLPPSELSKPAPTLGTHPHAHHVLNDGLPPFLLDRAARIRRATSSRILASYLPNRCSLARSSNASVGSTTSASAIAASRPIAEVNEMPSARQ